MSGSSNLPVEWRLGTLSGQGLLNQYNLKRPVCKTLIPGQIAIASYMCIWLIKNEKGFLSGLCLNALRFKKTKQKKPRSFGVITYIIYFRHNHISATSELELHEGPKFRRMRHRLEKIHRHRLSNSLAAVFYALGYICTRVGWMYVTAYVYGTLRSRCDRKMSLGRAAVDLIG